MLNCLTSLAMSTCVLKALPGKLDIKRHSPSILYLLVPSVLYRKHGKYSLFQADSDFSTLSLHEATPEEKEEAEKMKNKGSLTLCILMNSDTMNLGLLNLQTHMGM